MKKLLIVRHAKSDWEDINLPDFDRPLNSRGKKNAPEMASRLAKMNLVPEQIVSSPALRAITTANYFADGLGLSKNQIVMEPGIYEALPSTLLDIINNLDDSSSFTALFGHNPSLSSIVGILTDEDPVDLPTCSTVLIRFPFDSWKMVSAGTGDLAFIDYPKNGAD